MSLLVEAVHDKLTAVSDLATSVTFVGAATIGGSANAITGGRPSALRHNTSKSSMVWCIERAIGFTTKTLSFGDNPVDCLHVFSCSLWHEKPTALKRTIQTRWGIWKEKEENSSKIEERYRRKAQKQSFSWFFITVCAGG
ncbi:hypothetical protein [Paenibacillus sp. FSL H8-0034]|uniref:hypothetical protein n=1 Tax=Paenibacillus sp. FSL H8-0034 TaxID=2954671 RepID=UPI0030FA89A7